MILRSVGSFTGRHGVHFRRLRSSETAVMQCRLVITRQPRSVVALFNTRLPNTIVIRWVTINPLQRSQCNLASDNPEAESTSPAPGSAEVCKVVAPSCSGATPTHPESDSTSGYGVVWFLYTTFQQILANHWSHCFSGCRPPSIKRNIL